MRKFSTHLNEAENQIDVLKTKMTEYNSNKARLVSFLDKPNADELFENLLKTLKYKDNDLLRYEWSFQKAERDVKKYRELIDTTIKEYNTKKI